MAAVASLEAVRSGLLALHKLLLDRERSRYQREHGPIESQHAFLGLALGHAQFQWLRTLSELIVNMDEAMEDEDAGPERRQALIRQARELLAFVTPENEFQRRFAEARENNPDILVESSALYRLLRP